MFIALKVNQSLIEKCYICYTKNLNMTIELKKLFEVDENLNSKMVDTILKSIKENHEQGMDYIKFKQSIQNLMAMNMDEATSVKSAYATASTMGLNKEELIKSIYVYQGVIDKERDIFIDSLKNQIKLKIEDPKAEIIDISKKIANHQNEITKLQKEIELYNQKRVNVETEINQQEEKIENIRKEFLIVYQSFTKNLEDDKNSFETLL
jgi:ACT domain-containing protein